MVFPSQGEQSEKQHTVKEQSRILAHTYIYHQMALLKLQIDLACYFVIIIIRIPEFRMSSEPQNNLQDCCSQQASSQSYSQTSALHAPTLLPSFSHSAIKPHPLHSHLSPIPALQQSSLNHPNKPTYSTTPSKLCNPSRFATSDTKTRCLNQTSSLKSELIREYELALDQIESALADRNYELTKVMREMEIRIEEKDRYIQETTMQYEQQIETIEAAYYKATQKLMELQNLNKEQIIKLEDKEMAVHGLAENLRKLAIKYEHERNMLENEGKKKDEAISELLKMLEIEKEKNKNLGKSLGLVDFDRDEIKKLRSQTQSLKQTIKQKQKESKQSQHLIELLQNQLLSIKQQLQQMSQSFLMYKQSQRILGESNIISNIMLEELNKTKQKLETTAVAAQQNKKLLDKQNTELNTLRFENQTLSEYNKVLVERLQNSQHSQPKWASKTTSKLCFQGVL